MKFSFFSVPSGGKLIRGKVFNMFFKNKKKKDQEDLNQKVSKYQKWWQDQTEELSFSRSNSKKNKKSSGSCLKAIPQRKSSDDSFVYYEEN